MKGMGHPLQLNNKFPMFKESHYESKNHKKPDLIQHPQRPDF